MRLRVTAQPARGAPGFRVHKRAPVGTPALEPQISTPRAPGGPVAAVGEDGVAAVPRKHSLLWRLAVIDMSVLVVIVLLLAFTPVTIHAPLRPVEAVILFAGFVLIAAANL